MANFTAGTFFSDGVTNDVNAAKLNALVADAVPTSNLALTSTSGTIATFNSTTGTITTGVIPTLTSTTLITTGTGTAASPAIVPTGDTNTGIFFPAADTIAFSEGGAEAMRIDSGGNVGIGTTSPATTLNIEKSSTSGNVGSIPAIRLKNTNADLGNNSSTFNYSLIQVQSGNGTVNSTYGARYDSGLSGIYFGTESSHPLTFQTAGVERLRIDSSGNVGVGETSPTFKMEIVSSSPYLALKLKEPSALANAGPNVRFQAKNALGNYWDCGTISVRNTSASMTAGAESSYMTFYTATAGAEAERLRIDASGNLLVGTTTTNYNVGTGFRFIADATNPYMAITTNLATNSSNYHLYNTNATNNGDRFYVATNGGVYNFSANNSNLSDERLKTNINPSGNYLDKICSIPVKTFNYKDQGEDTEKTIGVLAQEVEAHIPELINNEGFGETPADGIPIKTIYQTDLQYVLMRCIQELKAENDSLKSRIEALEAA